MINDLIKIADALDKIGLKQEASFVDLLIKNSAEQARVVQDFVDDLKKALQNVSSSPNILPTINAQSLPEIIQVIDTLLGEKKYISGHGINITQNPINELAEGILALEDDIKKIDLEISNTKEENELKQLHREQENLKTKLKKLYNDATKIKFGRRSEDKKRYEQLKDIINKRRGQEIWK